jgi:hypothetical protein
MRPLSDITQSGRKRGYLQAQYRAFVATTDQSTPEPPAPESIVQLVLTVGDEQLELLR